MECCFVLGFIVLMFLFVRSCICVDFCFIYSYSNE